MAKPLTFSERISKLNLMSAGIKNNLDCLATVSLGEADGNKAASFVQSLNDGDAKQERLKSDLKECTADLEKTAGEADKFISDITKRIKIAIPQERWKEFGIDAKK